MTDLQPLRALLSQTERQRDAAVAEQLAAEAEHRAAQAKVEQLVTYRREYEARWHNEFCREGKIELVRCYQGFVTRLTQAVEQQQRAAGHAAARITQAMALVREHDMRTSALKKLVERRLKEHQAGATRAEQRDSDERATRAAWSHTAPAHLSRRL